MKKLISFLCRLPGTFVMTIISLLIVYSFEYKNIDGRWPVGVLLSFMITWVSNIYLWFIQGERTGLLIKGSKWFGIGITSLVTLFITCWIFVKFNETVKFPTDDGLQWLAFGSGFMAVLWAWFSLLWNLYIYKDFPIMKKIGQRRPIALLDR